MKKIDIHIVLFSLLLFLSILVAYLQVADHEFINFDDSLYVTENFRVQEGITLDGISWAFGFTDRAYWHPITWLSHMLDCELFGLNPGMHHLMNVFFHILNSIVLFLALRMMTGSLWRSAFVGALFALHPVNVDTVAWIAERKNLLSTLFWMLTMLAYAYYAQKPVIFRYVVTFCLFVLGLLSKPMLVTLPFVLLLLDYWPLRRIRPDFQKTGLKEGERKTFSDNKSKALRLILEKVPFFLLAVFMVFLSMASFRGHGDVVSTDIVSMKLRVANALVSYIHYFLKMVWPWNLTIYYPFPQNIPVIQSVLVASIIIIASIFCILKARRYPYLIVGWLWYLGTLVPVSGIIQAGLWPAMAERWAYVPFIGLFIIISWAGYDICSRFQKRDILFGSASSMIILVFMIFTWIQAGYWKNDYELFSHAIRVNDKNSVAYSNLADVFLKEGNIDKALSNYSQAVGLNPNDPTIHNNYAIALLKVGQFNDSIEHFQFALQRFPDDEQIYIGLGIAYAKQGKHLEAINSLSRALRVNPANAETHFQIAVLFGEAGKIDEAIPHYQKALTINPDYTDAGNNLRIITDHKNRIKKAIDVLEERVQRGLENPDILQKLAALYSQEADYNNALGCLHKSIEIQPDNADGYYNIACVYARQGEVQRSIQWLEKAFEKGFSNLELLKTDKDLDNIRDTEYFKKLLIENEAP